MVLTSIDLNSFFEKITTIIHEELIQFQTSNHLTEFKPVDTKYLCEFLGITEPTVIRLRKKGKIPFLEVGGSIRYDLQKVIDALESKTKK